MSAMHLGLTRLDALGSRGGVGDQGEVDGVRGVTREQERRAQRARRQHLHPLVRGGAVHRAKGAADGARRGERHVGGGGQPRGATDDCARDEGGVRVQREAQLVHEHAARRRVRRDREQQRIRARQLCDADGRHQGCGEAEAEVAADDGDPR